MLVNAPRLNKFGRRARGYPEMVEMHPELFCLIDAYYKDYY